VVNFISIASFLNISKTTGRFIFSAKNVVRPMQWKRVFPEYQHWYLPEQANPIARHTGVDFLRRLPSTPEYRTPTR
jgi:hypothetical protein